MPEEVLSDIFETPPQEGEGEVLSDIFEMPLQEEAPTGEALPVSYGVASPVLSAFRETPDGKYYADWSDAELSEAIYNKFHAPEGWTREEFDAQVWPSGAPPSLEAEQLMEEAPMEEPRGTMAELPVHEAKEVVVDQEGMEPIAEDGGTIAELPTTDEPAVTTYEEKSTIREVGPEESAKLAEARQEYENLRNKPWYEELVHSIQKTQFNLQLMGAEGVDDLRVSMGRMIGMDTEPLIAPIVESVASIEEATGVSPNQFLPWPASAQGDVSMVDYRDSLIREGHPLVQLAPVAGGLSIAAKIPMIARHIERLPKIWKWVANVMGSGGVTEGIAFSGEEPNFADFVHTPATEWLEKKPDDSELEGRAKNVIQGMALMGGMSLVGRASKYGVNKFFQGADHVIGKGDRILKPLKDRFGDIHKTYAHRIDKFELETHVMFADHFQRMIPFLKGFQKMSKKDQLALDLAAKNGDSKAIIEINRILTSYEKKIPGIKSAFNGTDDGMSVRQTLKELWLLGNKNGVEINFRRNYIPRFVKDYDELRKVLNLEETSKLEQALEKASHDLLSQVQKGTRATTDLTNKERMEVVDKFFQRDGLGERLGYTQPRQIELLEKRLMPLYMGLEDSLSRYARSLAYQVSKNRLIGKSPEHVSTSISRITEKLLREGQITGAQGDEVKRLLEVRLKGGERISGEAFKTYRDMVYMTKIANPISAITQASEIGLNAYRNGLLPAIKGLVKKKPLKLGKDLGIDDVAAEFSDPSKMNKALRDTLSWSGFKKLDVVMKEANIASSLEMAHKQVLNKNSKAYKKFVDEWGEYFGDDMDGLVKALRSKDVNDDNVRLLAYARLTKTQPIAMSEMTEAYIAGGGLTRSMYFLKTFTMKQFNVVREDVIKQLANPETTREGLKNLMRLTVYFGGAQTGTNWVKDFVLGRPFDMTDNAVTQGLAFLGQSKYVVYQTKREGLYGLVMAYAPPIPFHKAIREIITGGIEGDAEKMKESWKEGVQELPLGGKISHWRVPGLPGYERTQQDISDKFFGKD